MKAQFTARFYGDWNTLDELWKELPLRAKKEYNNDFYTFSDAIKGYLNGVKLECELDTETNTFELIEAKLD